MARVDTYLNFTGQTGEAFDFYMKVFGTQPVGDIVHYGDMPMDDWEISEDDKKKIMHISIPITGGHLLMGSDVLAFTGFEIATSTFSHIVLNPDSKEEADALFAALSDDAKVIVQAMADMPWGAYWGNLVDKFGVQWMVNVDYSQAG